LMVAACAAGEDVRAGRALDTGSPRAGGNGVVRWTGGEGVNVRAEPRADSLKVGSLGEGEHLAIACQIEGPAVQGNTVWDYVPAKQGYVTDAFVDSGWASWIPGVPKCGDSDEGCGDVDYFGECDGDELTWCEDDGLRTVDCGERSRVCAWRNDDIGFDCITAGGGDAPDGADGADGADGRLTITEIVGGDPYAVSQSYGKTDFDGGYAYCHDYASFPATELMHCGVDIAIPNGTPLFVPEDATAIVVGSPYFEDWNRPWAADAGELRLETATGTHIILGHMSRIDLRQGDGVHVGDVAGLSGYANGDHVHIEVRVPDGSFASGLRTVDPMEYFGL
jgi:hypothetical protein